VLWFVGLVGCITVVVEPAEWPEDTGAETPTDPTGTDPGETDPPTPEETDPPTTTEPDPCAESELVSVTSLVSAPGRMINQVELTAVTSSSVAVAARCVSDVDTTEVHLLEDLGGTEHVFQFSGLLTSTTYTCTAAPICPRSADPLPTVSVAVGAGPQGLAPVTVTIDPVLGMTGHYTLFNTKPNGACSGQGGFAQLVDPDGAPRFWHALPPLNVDVEVRHQGDGIFVFGGGYSPEGRPRIVDLWEGEQYASDFLPDATNTWFHHDGKMLDDGRIVTLEADTTNYLGTDFEGFAVRAHDPVTGVLSWEYRAQTGIDRGELPVRDFLDYDEWHPNWVDVEQENGQDMLYVSWCYYGWILKIDPISQTVVWIMGDGADLALVDAGGAPLDGFEFSQCQHGLEVDGDHVLVYDNGWYRGFSRVSEYEVDESTATARLLWTWEDDWQESTLGDADYLDNGRILTNKAHPDCWSYGTNSEIVEFDPLTGLAASRVRFDDIRDSTYRAERLDGCELFSNAKYCSTLADRLVELAPAFGE